MIFTPCCRYTGDNITVIDQELYVACNVVYAYVYADEILYIGKSKTSLRGRIKMHLRYMRTRKHPAEAFADYTDGKEITVLAVRAPIVTVLGIDVCVTSSLEEALLEIYKPRFNNR